jgi:hypothetical protein
MSNQRLTVISVEAELRRQLAHAQALGKTVIKIRAGELHDDIHGNDRVPLVCHAMRKLFQAGRDQVLYSPPSGQGRTFKIRYALPR